MILLKRGAHDDLFLPRLPRFIGRLAERPIDDMMLRYAAWPFRLMGELFAPPAGAIVALPPPASDCGLK